MDVHSALHLTPFLDARVVVAARAIPPEWKIHGEKEIEKYILREAFRDLLPPQIADRAKLRFAAGSSVDDIMDRIAERHVLETDFAQNRVTVGKYRLNSLKEYWYYQTYRRHFPDPGFEGQVARWDPFK